MFPISIDHMEEIVLIEESRRQREVWERETNMKLELAEMVAEVLNGMGYEAEVREGYSGRGMMGRETAGVVTEVNGVRFGYAVALAIVGDEKRYSDNDGGWARVDALHGFHEIPDRSDSMGLSKIYY